MQAAHIRNQAAGSLEGLCHDETGMKPRSSLFGFGGP